MLSPTDPSVVSAFTGAEWALLVRLPGRVVIAATSAEADSPARTVAEGLAGIDAIAAGRDLTNPLVRAVAGAIHATPDAPVAEEFADRRAGITEVLESCRQASSILLARVDAADRLAYRDWVTSIASRVCEASRSGGILGVGGTQISADERRFLLDLAAAFGS